MNDQLIGMPPEIVEILQTLVDNHIPEWHTLGPLDARRVYEERVALFPSARTSVGFTEDLYIDGPGGDLALRLYAPSLAGPWPVLVYLHGGGWMLGGLESHDELCRRLCVSSGAMIIAVDYRLAPEHPFPAALDDSIAALEWAAANIDSYGGDPTRLAVGGDSAGGNLAAAIAHRLRNLPGPRIALSLMIYPALSADFDRLSFYENATGKLISTADTIWFWRNYLGAERPGNIYAEPGAASDLSDLAPSLIITAGFDPLRDDGEIYAHRLSEAHSSVLLKRYPGMIHGFMGLPVDLPEKEDALSLIADCLHRAWSGINIELE